MKVFVSESEEAEANTSSRDTKAKKNGRKKEKDGAIEEEDKERDVWCVGVCEDKI